MINRISTRLTKLIFRLRNDWEPSPKTGLLTDLKLNDKFLLGCTFSYSLVRNKFVVTCWSELISFPETENVFLNKEMTFEGRFENDITIYGKIFVTNRKISFSKNERSCIVLTSFEWEIKKQEDTCSIWVTKVNGKFQYDVGNIELDHSVKRKNKLISKYMSSSRCIFFEGAYEHYLIADKDIETKKWFIITKTKNFKFDEKIYYLDIIAMQFCLGTAISSNLIFNLNDLDETVFIRPYTIKNTDGDSTFFNKPVVPDEYLSTFFQHLSKYLHSLPKHSFNIPIEYYINSLSSPLSDNYLKLHVGISSLSFLFLSSKELKIEKNHDPVFAIFDYFSLKPVSEMKTELTKGKMEILNKGIIDGSMDEKIRKVHVLQMIFVSLVSKIIGYKEPIYPFVQYKNWLPKKQNTEVKKYYSTLEEYLQKDEKKYTIFVESKSDAYIVKEVLSAAKYPLERLCVDESSNLNTILEADWKKEDLQNTIFLISMSVKNITDAKLAIQKLTKNRNLNIFCAIPNVSSWLFADDKLFMQKYSENQEYFFNRLPLPEEIPDPEELALKIFGEYTNWSFLQNIDIEHATSRSPSLRMFLIGLAELLDIPYLFLKEGGFRSASRNLLASLLDEIPSETIIWRTVDNHSFTAEDLKKEIRAGSEIGRLYASDLLRVSRDLLNYEANRGEKRQ
ncbi:hypothetical protein [Candidatus Uabimicrobium sp. HlEnr_7]|uniref:hypothetical protein n=1 Tax=Candidatus Uabimicrobium helgolandensis TaxID=3095367 RepID=UPI00355707AA